jgi:hypothetical protein
MAGYGRNNVMRKSVKSTANTAVSLETNIPKEDKRMFIQALFVGYGGTGTLAGGLLTVEDGMVIEGTKQGNMELPIGSKGTQELEFMYQGGPNEAVKFTLAAGGSEVTGYMTVVYYID